MIGAYRMGFELRADGKDSSLRVFIEYAWPETGVGPLLGRLLAGSYARWCTRQMVDDAVAHFDATRQGPEEG
jgi:hypothetical protein